MIKMMSNLLLLLLLTACSNVDYTEFKRSNPKSILVLPPINNSPDVQGTNAIYAQVTKPLAESGYYVLPVTLVNETFKQNGLLNNHDINQAPLDKLYKVFGADAVLYLTITEYGTSYRLLWSETKATLKAKLVDARTGKLLWQYQATASSRENKNANDDNNNNDGDSFVTALADQMIDTQTGLAYNYAGYVADRLLTARLPITVQMRKQYGFAEGSWNRMLFGPRSPYYRLDGGTYF